MRHRIPRGFVVAMRGSIIVAEDTTPFRPGPRQPEWLIVSRWGDDAEHLTIACTGTEPGETATAPIGLTPRTTILGVLAWEHPAAAEAVFLLMRRQPKDMPLAGEFLPAEGFARITIGATGGVLRLAAAGRNARLGSQRMPLGAPGSPDDAPANTNGRRHAWRIIGDRRPWLGEVVEPHETFTGPLRAPAECCMAY